MTGKQEVGFRPICRSRAQHLICGMCHLPKIAFAPMQRSSDVWKTLELETVGTVKLQTFTDHRHVEIPV